MGKIPDFNIMTPEELKEITNHFFIAKLESDLKIDKIFSEVLFSLDTNDKIVSMQLIKVNLKIAEIERQLKELKDGKS